MRIISLVVIVMFFLSCDKSENAQRIHCRNLITDTSGTNDIGRIYMPDAFTPNGDGVNDISRPLTQNIASIEFTIYDAGDAVVFSTTQLNTGWQTTNVPNTSSKYYYRIQAVTASGNRIGLCGTLYKLGCFPTGVSRNSIKFEDQLLMNGTWAPTSIDHNMPDCI